MSTRGLRVVLRDNIGLVVVATLAGLLVALVVHLVTPPTYTASTVLYVSSSAAPNGPLPPEQVALLVELVGGERVASDASRLLGGTPTLRDIRARVHAENDGSLITLEADGSTSDEAVVVDSAVSTAFSRLVSQLGSADLPVNRPATTVQVVSPPSVPTGPSWPSLPLLLAAGAVVGLVVGSALALVAHRRRPDVVRDPESLVRRLGAQVLGAVGRARETPRHPAVLLDALGDGRRARTARRRAAIYRSVAADVVSALGAGRVVAFVGPARRQFTSSTAAEVAVALAVRGERVLLVDADLRAGTQASRLGLPSSPGLRELVAGARGSDAVIQRWPTAGVDVLAAGELVDRPETVFGARTARVALRDLAAKYDRVVVDTAGGPGAPSAVDVARAADGVVLVVRRGTRIEDLDVTVAALRLAGSPIVGAVLTDALDTLKRPSAVVAALSAAPPTTHDGSFRDRPEDTRFSEAERSALEEVDPGDDGSGRVTTPDAPTAPDDPDPAPRTVTGAPEPPAAGTTATRRRRVSTSVITPESTSPATKPSGPGVADGARR